MKITRLVIMLILLTCLFDAARDVVMFKWDWWPRHIVKWLAFFPSLTFLLFYFVKEWKDRLMMIFASFIIWRLSYEAFLQITLMKGN